MSISQTKQIDNQENKVIEPNNEIGGCLCGAVRFSANEFSKKAGACHCGMCRKWGGGPLMAVDCGAEVAFKGEENITVFDSSDWAERGFCKKCGSHLFYRLKQNQQHMIPVGLFDDQQPFVFNHQVFIDKKPAFYSFANETKNMTEAEIFAMYGSS
jgi:hypothetical protein